MIILKIHCITHQWLKLHLWNFHTFHFLTSDQRYSTLDQYWCSASLLPKLSSISIQYLMAWYKFSLSTVYTLFTSPHLPPVLIRYPKNFGWENTFAMYTSTQGMYMYSGKVVALPKEQATFTKACTALIYLCLFYTSSDWNR